MPTSTHTMSRRQLLQQSLVAAGALSLPRGLFAEDKKPRHILLRSSWQTVNIGDIGHTPGLLRLLELHVPKAKVTLWPSKVDRGVDKLLLKTFPWLNIAEGSIDKEGKPTSEALKNAFDSCDFLLHGSGPSIVALSHVMAWHKATSKPFGIYGVTITTINQSTKDLLAKAAFMYCRDTHSLEYLKDQEVACPIMEFAPDSTFAIHLRDDERAAAYLKENGLEERRFLCAIPRLRYTPYTHYPEAEQKKRAAVSDEFKEVDHAKMREAIIAWVRKTGQKVLVCPEMTYQLEVMDELLINPLPADVKKLVVKRGTYWLPDEAGSVYAKARAIVSFEMHSPIISASMGTPAMYLRQPTDTRKGQMWRDIGLKDWIFEIDEAKGEEIAARVLSIHDDYPAALKKLADAMKFVGERQRITMAVVGKSAGV